METLKKKIEDGIKQSTAKSRYVSVPGISAEEAAKIAEDIGKDVDEMIGDIASDLPFLR